MALRPGDIEDEMLVLQCRQGDRAAFDKLVARWQRPFLNYAARLTGRQPTALDAVQETWMAIIKGMLRLRDATMFRAWAFRILSNQCHLALRNESRRRQAGQGLADRHAAAAGDGRECADLETALGRVPAGDREILLLKYQQDFSVAEIAEILNVPPGTVKSRLYHAREKLRQLLKGQ